MTIQLESRRSSVDAQRRRLMHWLLVLTGVFALGFSLLNFNRDLPLLAGVEFLVAILALVLILLLPRIRRIQLLSFVYLMVLFSALVVALLTPGVSEMVFVWFYLIPVLAHFVHGRRFGLIISLVLLSAAWFLYAQRYYDARALNDALGLFNIVTCSFVLTGGVYAYEFSREQAAEKLYQLASTDSLTGLANRKYLRELLDYTLEYARRTGGPFTLLGVDLDHFKSINDRYGHDVGDQVLRGFADILRERLRSADTPARWGGEEFLILLPGTDGSGALNIAEVLREAVAAQIFDACGERISVTISIGIAQFPGDGTTVQQLLETADHRLYEAKDKGRDCVVTEAAI